MTGMMPRDLYRLRTVGDPRLSPDGSTVAFTVTTLDEGSNAPLGAIWVVPTDGSEPPRRVTSGTARDATPRWSPDGRSLAFTSNRDGQDTMQLYVLPWARSGEPRQLTHLPESVTAPSWSPDGTRLAFVARVRDPAYAEEDDRAREPRRITRLFYRLDDEGWTFDRPQHLFVVSADGSGEPTQLTDGDHEDESPAWSPDGRRVVFTSARHPDWDLTTVRDLYVVDADEPGEPQRLTAGEGSFALPSWSPDGGAIASLLTPGDMDEPRHARVAVTDVATGETTIRTGELDRTAQPFPAVREPAWRDDGSLVFAIEDRGTVALWQVPADGGTGATPLVAPEGACLSGCDTPPRGEPVVARTTPVEPPDLFAGDRRLTTFGREDGAAIGSGSPERFTVETTAGPIDAWLFRPPEADPGRQLPTVLNIHGGPFAQYADRFFDEFQIQGGAGYAVLACNPRGSSGATEAWGRAIRGPVEGGPGWGTVDVDDVLAVLDAAIERFDVVDPDRLAVMGGSYGGFMTSWIVAHSDRFRCAISERAVNQFVSEDGTADIAGMFRSEIGAPAHEAPEAYLRVSPWSYAKDIETPLLLLHSESDLRCPIGQAEELFTALRSMRKTVEFVRFPAESHELSRSGSPRHRVRRFEIVLEWLDRWLR